MYSTRRRSLSLLRHFFQIGARLDITNDWGFNVFHFLGTSSWEHPEQAAYLSSLQIAGVDPDAPTLIGNSPIHFLESRARNSEIPGDRTHHDAFAFVPSLLRHDGGTGTRASSSTTGTDSSKRAGDSACTDGLGGNGSSFEINLTSPRRNGAEVGMKDIFP